MFDDEPQPPPRNNNRRQQEPQFNWKGLVLLLASGLIILWAYVVSQRGSSSSEKNFAEFRKIVNEGRLWLADDKPLYLVEEPGTGLQFIEGRYVEVKGESKQPKIFRTNVNIQYQKEEIASLLKNAPQQENAGKEHKEIVLSPRYDSSPSTGRSS